MICSRCDIDHLEEGAIVGQIPEYMCRGALWEELDRLRTLAGEREEMLDYHDKVMLDFAREEFGPEEEVTWKAGFTTRKFVEMVRDRIASCKLNARQLELQNGELIKALKDILKSYEESKLKSYDYSPGMARIAQAALTEKRNNEFEDRTLCYKTLDKGFHCTLPSGHAGGCNFVLVK